MGSQRAQTYAAAAIASISEDPQHKEPIIKTGAILPLVRLVRNTAAIDAQVHAANAIANLSSENGAAQNAFYAAGVFPLLLELLESGKTQEAVARDIQVDKSNEINQAEVTRQWHADIALLNVVNSDARAAAAAAIAAMASAIEPTRRT